MRRASRLARFVRADDGAAAVEAALVGGLLIGALLNVAEIGRYAWVATEVSASSQAGVQAALSSCDPTKTPVTVNCTGLNSLITTSIQGSTLGAKVTVKGSPSEAWYCLNAQNALQEVGPVTATKPANCAAVGDTSSQPGLYLKVTVTSTYQPMFPGLTLAENLPKDIERAAWMRVL